MDAVILRIQGLVCAPLLNLCVLPTRLKGERKSLMVQDTTKYSQLLIKLACRNGTTSKES